MSVLLLNKKLDFHKWSSLFILFLGVSLSQFTPELKMDIEMDTLKLKAVGLIAIVAACCTSGFAGVYFEKILKFSTCSLWIRNIQLGLFGTILGMITVYTTDFLKVKDNGFFQGYNSVVWLVILLQVHIDYNNSNFRKLFYIYIIGFRRHGCRSSY